MQPLLGNFKLFLLGIRIRHIHQAAASAEVGTEGVLVRLATALQRRFRNLRNCCSGQDASSGFAAEGHSIVACSAKMAGGLVCQHRHPHGMRYAHGMLLKPSTPRREALGEFQLRQSWFVGILT